jgi:hypothetical protein
MALRITRGDDPITVDQLVVCIYAPPGLGKSTLGFSAHKPLMLDFDRGAHRTANRGDSVQIESWDMVTSIADSDLADYQTVVIDTAGRALDLLSADIIRRNPKMGRGGALTLQGYGQLKSEFVAWLKNLRTMGKDVVLIAHSSEDKSGDDLIERIDMQGGSKGEVYKVADAMGRLSMVPGKRFPVLNFSPSDAAFGKNPGQLDPLDVPDVATDPQFLGTVIETIKERLNALTEDQKQRQAAIGEWIEKIKAAEDAESVNALVPEAKDVDEAIRATVKGALHKHAESIGLEFSASAGGYIAREAA